MAGPADGHSQAAIPPAGECLPVARGSGDSSSVSRTASPRWIGEPCSTASPPGSTRSCATSSRAIATTGRRTRPGTPPPACSRVAPLRALYGRLLRHATLCLLAEDVLDFLGRKLHGGFAGEVLTEWKRRLTTPHSVSLRGKRLFIAPICAECTVTWEEEDSCPHPHPGLPRGFGEGLGGGAPDEQRRDLR